LLARDTIKLRGGTYDCPFTEVGVNRLSQVTEHHGYGEPFEAAGYEVTFFDAGHIPGSAHVLVSDGGVGNSSGGRTESEDGETRLLYTGDFATEDQRLVPGTTARPEADAVITESTYADVERDPRERIEERFVQRLQRTVRGGGTVVVPAFAIGRTQEVLLACAAHGIDCYVDGMGVEVTRILRRHPEFVRDADALGRAAANARVVDGGDGQRRRIARQPTVIVTTSGMLHGGPAMTYVPEIRDHPGNLVALVGHQVEGSPGRELLESGRAELDGRVMPVSAQVEVFDFSAHADRSGLLSVLDSYRDAEVLVNHGDRCETFAAELREAGYDAVAPELGETVSL
jgi:putative mRNA 3-end processing factor